VDGDDGILIKPTGIPPGWKLMLHGSHGDRKKHCRTPSKIEKIPVGFPWAYSSI